MHYRDTLYGCLKVIVTSGDQSISPEKEVRLNVHERPNHWKVSVEERASQVKPGTRIEV